MVQVLSEEVEARKDYVKLVCDCGGTKFKIRLRSIVEDVYNFEGHRAWASENEYTTLSEDCLEVFCLKCGKRLLEKYQEKPIPFEAWEEFWSGHIIDFIIGFEHYVVNREVEPGEDGEEAFLRGISKGMWAMYNLIESEMVEEELVKPREAMKLIDEAINVLSRENSPQEYEQTIKNLCITYNILNAKSKA